MVLPGRGRKEVRDPDSVDAMHHPARVLGTRSSEEVSPLDHAIIDSLQQDGRRPFTQIAAELGVSEAAIRTRTNRLIERGVLQIVGVADPLKLGYDQMAMIGVRCEADRMLEAADAIAEFEEVIYVVATAGAWDLMVEVVCLNNEDLLTFLTQKLRRIPGVVSTESFVYLRIVKQSFHWTR